MRTTRIACAARCVPLALVMVVSLGPVTSARAEVTRLEVRWTSSPPNMPPHLRALAGPTAATAGCWPTTGSNFGPCPSAPQTRWVEANPNADGVPQTISFVDESADQERDFEFEALAPCVPACSDVTLNATIRHADGSTVRVGPIRLGHYRCGQSTCGWAAGATVGKSLGASSIPPPETGETFNVAAERGKVTVRLPNGRTVRVKKSVQIVTGSVVDTRQGAVRLSAEGAGGRIETGVFSDGLFRITQTKGKRPVTNLKLVEKLASCPKRGVASAAAPRKRKRRLWGDARGNFRTRGRYGNAINNGTKWLTEDRCDGTLFRVRRGRILVRRNGNKRAVLVRAGDRHLVRPPK